MKTNENKYNERTSEQKRTIKMTTCTHTSMSPSLPKKNKYNKNILSRPSTIVQLQFCACFVLFGFKMNTNIALDSFCFGSPY